MSFNYSKSKRRWFLYIIKFFNNGREGVDFLIGGNEIYLQSIDLDTSQRSIKIAKQDLGELKDNLFIVLVLIIEQHQRLFI